jgi:GR25 family glycosyltransferase involved in LPS biosynthesis
MANISPTLKLRTNDKKATCSVVIYIRARIENLAELVDAVKLQQNLYVYFASIEIAQQMETQVISLSQDVIIVKVTANADNEQIANRLSLLNQWEITSEYLLIIDQDRIISPFTIRDFLVNETQHVMKTNKLGNSEDSVVLGYWGWQLQPPETNEQGEIVTQWESMHNNNNRFVWNVNASVDYLCGMWFSKTKTFSLLGKSLGKTSFTENRDSLLGKSLGKTSFTENRDSLLSHPYENSANFHLVEDIFLCLKANNCRTCPLTIAPRHVKGNVYHPPSNESLLRDETIRKFCENGYRTAITRETIPRFCRLNEPKSNPSEVNVWKDPFYFINLDRRKDRAEELIRAYDAVSHNYPNRPLLRRSSAVDAQHIYMNPFLCYLLRNNTFQCKRAIVACALSHIYIWQKFLENSYQEYVVIFEDDVIFCPNFIEKWLTIISSVRDHTNKFDLIYLGYRLNPSLESVKSNNIYTAETFGAIELAPMYNNTFYWAGAECYLLSRRGAQFLLNVLSQYGLTQPIDTIMMYAYRNHYATIGEFKAYAAVPRLGTSPLAEESNQVDSDIQRELNQVPYKLVFRVDESIQHPLLDDLTRAGEAPDQSILVYIMDKLTQENKEDKNAPVFIYDMTNSTLSYYYNEAFFLDLSLLLLAENKNDKELMSFINQNYFRYWAHNFKALSIKL